MGLGESGGDGKASMWDTGDSVPPEGGIIPQDSKKTPRAPGNCQDIPMGVLECSMVGCNTFECHQGALLN